MSSSDKSSLLLRILRRFGLFIFTLVFFTAVSLLLIVAPLTVTVARPETLKRWASESGVYEQILPAVLEQAASGGVQAEKGGDKGQSPENQLDPAAVRDLFNQVLPPDVIKGYVETAVDNIFAWLKGEVPQPEFSIDLTDRKPALAAAFEEYVKAKLANAPTCTRAQLAGELDPLAQNCLPPGKSVDEVAAAAGAELTSAEGPLTNLTFDSKTFIDEMRRQRQAEPQKSVDIDRVLDTAPVAYQQLLLLPWYALGAIALSATALMLLNHDKMRAGRGLAIKVAVNAGLVAATTFVATRLFSSFLQRTTVSVAERDVNLTKTLEPVYRTVVTEIAQAVYLFALPAFGLAVVTIIVISVILHKQTVAFRAHLGSGD